MEVGRERKVMRKESDEKDGGAKLRLQDHLLAKCTHRIISTGSLNALDYACH
jgi:hypothetical protein